jgi:hypothetical protein
MAEKSTGKKIPIIHVGRGRPKNDGSPKISDTIPQEVPSPALIAPAEIPHSSDDLFFGGHISGELPPMTPEEQADTAAPPIPAAPEFKAEDQRPFADMVCGFTVVILAKFFGPEWLPQKIQGEKTDLDSVKDALIDWLVELGWKPLRAVHRFWLAVAAYCAPRMGSVVARFTGRKRPSGPLPPASQEPAENKATQDTPNPPTRPAQEVAQAATDGETAGEM